MATKIIKEAKINGYNIVVREIRYDNLVIPIRYLCGYVEIPRNHPWHGVEFYDKPEDIIDIHGGITYSGDLKREGKWYLGFDCGHAFDNPEEQNLEYVLKELEKLVEQAKEQEL